MPTLDEDGWQLESARAPDTYEIPDESIRARLVPASAAKLIFSLKSANGPQVERMWVEITGYTDAGYDNEPRTADASIALGHVIEFGPDHIIDALPPVNWNPETGEYED